MQLYSSLSNFGVLQFTRKAPRQHATIRVSTQGTCVSMQASALARNHPRSHARVSTQEPEADLRPHGADGVSTQAQSSNEISGCYNTTTL